MENLATDSQSCLVMDDNLLSRTNELSDNGPDDSTTTVGGVVAQTDQKLLTTTTTKPMTMADALESLNISYSPLTQQLQQQQQLLQQQQQQQLGKKDTEHHNRTEVIRDETDNHHTYYKPGHRKAYSLPRTLEGVDDNGTIAHAKVEHDVVNESPRTTMQRYGIQYQPYNFHHDDQVSCVSPSDVSAVTRLSDQSSLGDSGVFSETSDKVSVKRGLGDFLSKGLAANLKLLSRSGEKMVKMVKKETDVDTGASVCASSQSLIMETRPPGVPAKTTEEVERHKQEHRVLLEKIRRKEQTENKTRAQKLAEQKRNEDDLSELTSYWLNTVIPNWATLSSSKKIQSLWWRGLPPPVRGKVWRLGLSNTLNLTTQLYQILVTRSREQLANVDSFDKCQVSREETLELIRLDVSRTFPQLCIFQQGGPYYQLLHNVIGAYVCYRPDIGYVQGMSFIAAILILNLDEADAFIMLANILNWPLLSAFFSVDQPKMEQYYSDFSQQMSHHLPTLSDHFTRLGLRPDLYLLDWMMTVFSRCCPLDLTCRIWDMIIRDGEVFMMKAGLGILSLYQEKLLSESDFILIAQFLSKLPDDINGHLLFEKIEALGSSSSKRTFANFASFW